MLLRNLAISLVTFVYFAFSCGVVLNYHICMNTIASVRIYHKTQKKCSICGMQTKKRGCCRDEVRVVKVNNHYYRPSGTDCKPALELVAAELSEHGIFAASINLTDFSFPQASPPIISEQDLYLKIGVLRI